MVHVIEGLGVLGLVLCAYVGYLIVMGLLETKSAPRRPMLWCEKHGAILEEYCIDFMGQRVCSICFHQKLKTAEGSGQK